MTALRMSFEVACSAEHAFHTWTQRIALWWPLSHTMTGEEHLKVVLEPRAGGRIYERTRSGREVEWGQVVAWEPPLLLGLRWHLGADASLATDVVLTFSATGDNATTVELVHTGWDRIGPEGAVRRQRNHAGWNAVFAHFATAVHEPPTATTEGTGQ